MEMSKTLVFPDKENKQGKHTNHLGDHEWFVDGKRHRDGAPALINATGFRAWYQNGLKHRDNGPAVYRMDAGAAWFKHDKRHRDNGPAIISFKFIPDPDRFFLDGIEVTDPLVIKMILAKGVRDNEPRTDESFYRT